jgi:hypothetical protein
MRDIYTMKDVIKAKIRTGSGIEMTIESDRRTVQEIVSEIHRREESRARFREEFEKRRELERKRLEEFRRMRNETVHNMNPGQKIGKDGAKTKLILFTDLIKQGFFGNQRNLGDVQKALEEKGYHYPASSLSPTLLRLVRSGVLKRTKHVKGEKEVWVYSAREKNE